MMRTWAVGISALMLIVAGCGLGTYEKRLEGTLKRLKREQKIDSFLQPAAEGKFKEMSVYLRPPKPMAESKLMLTEPPGMFDLATTFLGGPAAPPAAQGEEAAPAAPPLRLHVLGRMKKAAAKKGEAPPAEAVARGAFIGDVRAYLANELGPDANTDKSPTNDKKGVTTFKRLIFPATSGDTIQVYFIDANKGQTEVALIFDIPPALLKLPIATTGIELCLESFAIGTPAQKLFNSGGKSDGEDGEAAGSGSAF